MKESDELIFFSKVAIKDKTMSPNKKLTMKCAVAKLYYKPYMGWMLKKDWAVHEGYVWKRYELKTMPFNR